MKEKRSKRPKAVTGSTEARRLTVSLSVTEEIKDALESITKEKKSQGRPWSVNRELWERISYTFSLTGLDGDIEPHVRQLKSDADRIKARRDLGTLVNERGDFLPFEHAGLPKIGEDLDGLPVKYNYKGRSLLDELTGGALPPRFQPIADIVRLRERHTNAVTSLAMRTDISLTDQEYEQLQTLGASENSATLKRLLDEAEDKWSRSYFLPKPTLARRRALSAINTEYESLQELSATMLLYDYLIGWRAVIDRRAEELEPHVTAPDYSDRLSVAADAAVSELTNIDRERAARTRTSIEWAASTGDLISSAIDAEG